MVRATIGLGLAAPAVILALLSAASLGYFFGFMKPLADAVDAFLPIDIGDADPVAALLTAVGMGALSIGLLRGKTVAWWLTVATLAVALFCQGVTFARPLGVVIVGGVLAVLVADNRRYEVQTSASWRRTTVAMLVVAGVIIGLEASLVIAATGDWPAPLAAFGVATTAIGNALGIGDETSANVLRTASHDVLLALLIAVGRLPIVLAAIGVLSPVGEEVADPTTRARARAIGSQFGCGALLPFQLGDDKYVFSPDEAVGLVVYGAAAGTTVVLGDPIGPPDQTSAVVTAFLARSRRRGRMPLFYQLSETSRQVMTAAGFRLFPVGNEAIIKLADFELSGSRRANLRHTITRCRKDGVSIRWFASGIDQTVEPGLVEQLRAIDEQWRAAMGPEMGFSISHFEVGSLRWQPIAVAITPEGRALGFTTFRPTGIDGGYVLDLMRRTDAAPPGVVEFCVAEAAFAFRESGSATLSLGLAPLAGLSAAGPFEERLLAIGSRLVHRWYDVRGLERFKAKFDPVWVPRYGATRHRRDFAAFVLGLLLVHVNLGSMLPRWRRAKAEPAIGWSRG